MLLNINRLSTSIDELNWWLEEQINGSRKCHVFHMTEPLLTPTLISKIHPSYSISSPNPPSELSQNPHFSTCTLINTHGDTATISPATMPDEHLGITFSRISSTDLHCPPIYSAVVYIPSPNCPEAYTTSIYETLSKNVTYIVELGGLPLIAMDANCPFKHPGDCPAGRNYKYLAAFLKKHKLVILNWCPKGSGFYTRVRGAEQSQLDIIVGPASIIDHIEEIRIRTDIHFGSDHCGVELLLSHRPKPAPAPVPRKVRIYEWSKESEEAYCRELELRLPACDIAMRAALCLAAGPMKAQKEAVADLTESITEIIVSSCRNNVPNKEITVGGRKHKPKPYSSETVVRVAQRDLARQQLQSAILEFQVAPENSLERDAESLTVCQARSELEARQKDLLDCLTRDEHTSARKSWSHLSQLYTEDKSAFAAGFKKSIQSQNRSLPESLVVNQRDIRKVTKIKKVWVERFEPSPHPPPSPQNQQFQDKVRDKNKVFAKNKDYDKGGKKFMPHLNGPIVIEETKQARTKAETGKSPSDDGILNEMLKRGGLRLLISLTLLLNVLWALEITPSQWKSIIISPVYKRASIFDPKNYRPISLLSNLFKLYERVIDSRIRAVISIIVEQCGFRPGFGTDTQLLRLSILMKHCKARNQGLWFAFLDLEEAFERAWRSGILYQLWVAGVRGKCWRVVKEILSGITAFVRTNFGDTTKFRLPEGVLQGSVLAAILFLVFINPLVDALRPHCPIFNGIQIAAQLFADDIVLPSDGSSNRSLLIRLTIAWSRRWLSSIKDPKSYLLSTTETELPDTIVWGKIFRELSQVLHLGAGIDREGVLHISHVYGKIEDYIKRLDQLTNAGLHLGGIRADACVDLFEQSALSLVSYCFALCPPGSRRVKLLDDAQSKFAADFLGLPASTAGTIVKSELGLLDFDLRVTRSLILMLHRVQNNDLDPLTKHMLHWPISHSGATMLSQGQEALSAIISNTPISKITSIPYLQASLLLKQACHSTQRTRWLEGKQNVGALGTHTRAKGEWGFEEALICHDACEVKFFLRMRCGAFIPPSTPHHPTSSPKCSLCLAFSPGLNHVLWQCPHFMRARSNFLSSLPPNTRDHLMSESPDSATSIILGGGGLISQREWLSIRGVCINFIAHVVSNSV